MWLMRYSRHLYSIYFLKEAGYVLITLSMARDLKKTDVIEWKPVTTAFLGEYYEFSGSSMSEFA